MTIDLIVGVFVWALGLCVGSFLNVVVYRLPRGLSISRPRRSFCPNCRREIAWYDNIPVLSWLALRARCRNCQTPISPQYPIVEAITGLAFVLTYYLLFIAGARYGVTGLKPGLDWLYLAAWLTLVAGLIACSAMDIASYLVDVRITLLVIAAGVVLHALWPAEKHVHEPAETAFGAAAIAGFIVSIFMLWLTVWREPDTDEADDEAEQDSASPLTEQTARTDLFAGVLAVLACAAAAIWLLYLVAITPPPQPPFVREDGVIPWLVYDPYKLPGGLAVQIALLCVFVVTVLAGSRRRDADEEVRAVIEEEEPRARLIVLRELLWLLPIILAGFAAYFTVEHWTVGNHAWHAGLAWAPGTQIHPLAGAAYAIVGTMAGALVGWVLRIGFTLIFGREAMGVGDIYILAAIGAVGGADIMLLSLLGAVGAAILGLILGLMLKRSTVIPFGPWLAIGCLVALYVSVPASNIGREYAEALTKTWADRRDVCYMAGGIMLVGTAVAVVLARLTRRLIEPAALDSTPSATADNKRTPAPDKNKV